MTDQAGMHAEKRRKIEVIETEKIPRLDILFGFGPTVPFIAGATLAWCLLQPSRMIVLQMVAPMGLRHPPVFVGRPPGP